MPKFLKIDQLVERIIDFIKVKLEVVKVDLMEQGAKLAANMISLTIVLMLCLLMVGFLSAGIAHLLNRYLESTFWGYMIIAGFYALVTIVFIRFWRSGKFQEVVENVIAETNKEKEEENS